MSVLGPATLTPDTDAQFVGIASPAAGFRRGEMQIIYRNGQPGDLARTCTLIADDANGRCQVQGTAIPAS